MKLTDFLTATGSTRMAQRTKDAVRLVLVDGMRIIDVARQMDMKHQQVAEAVARIEAAHKALKGVPENWECVTVCVPPDKAKEILAIEKDALRMEGLLVD